MDRFVNMEILGNPINWLMITVILTFTFYAGYVLWTNASGGPLATGA
jgi:hypothetical protein